MFNYITLDELKENFEFIEDWEEKYAYIIELGKKLPSYPEELKVDEKKITGCVSQVWLDYKVSDGRVFLRGDSDAMIVKGLIYILFTFYNAKNKKEFESSSCEDFLMEIGLNDHISPQRANGINSMISKLGQIFDSI